MQSDSFNLLRTKLHAPPVTADHVYRPRLLERLEEDPNISVVLVVAPAVYGKSALVTSWLQRARRASGWLSLDENDNDPQRFLSYFVACVQSIFPDTLRDSLDLIRSPSLPPMEVIAPVLINDLDRIDQEFIVVLDDVHCISNRDVADLISRMLRNPPKGMQLVLVGRRDPFLPIASLRAGGTLLEVRVSDLRFTLDESADFLNTLLPAKLDSATVSAMVEQSEGWITGLRLAVMAFKGEGAAGRETLERKAPVRYVVDYLLSEVLEQQPVEVRELLLISAVPDRFCVSLCNALVAESTTPAEKTFDGQALIDWLQENNLFIIALDAENEWFRYHHMFRELLLNQLKRLQGTEQVSFLRIRASAWCEARGLIEESLDYAGAAGNGEAVADIVERHRDAEFNANRWHVVRRWLSLLPDDVKQKRVKILLTDAWVRSTVAFQIEDVPPLIQRVQALLDREQGDTSDRYELLHLQGFSSFYAGNGREAETFLRQGHELLPDDSNGFVRAELELYVALSVHMSGHPDAAIQTLNTWRDRQRMNRGMVWERLQFGLAVLPLLSADLASASHEAQIFLDEGERTGNIYVVTWGEYLQGIIAFHYHDLKGACEHFGQIARNRYVAHQRMALDSLIGLAVAAEMLGEPGAAEQWVREARDYARWTEVESFAEHVLSCEAGIALLRGDLDSAVRWRRGIRLPPPAAGMLWFVGNPWVTECRVLVAQGTVAALLEAADKLHRLRQKTDAFHYACHTMEILVLQALVADGQGRHDQSLDVLQEAVDLAEPGGWIRPFVEPGTAMVPLLQQLLERNPATAHARRILAAFPTQPLSSTGVQSSPAALSEPLTWRQEQVLNLLADRLRNKEISARLNISPQTVKAHLRAIYEKLGVRTRREAVEKSRELGILD